MRIPLLPALLLVGLASCVAPPQQRGAAYPAAPPALAAMFAGGPATQPAVVAGAPPTVATVAYQPATFPWPWLRRSARGRLTLGNYTFALADVEAIVTPYPDCALHAGLAARDFKLPLNGTWVIDTPPGADVCWRRLPGPAQPGEAQATPPVSPGWNRAFTGVGRAVDAQL